MAKLDVKGINNSLVFVFSQEGTAEEYQALLKEKLAGNPNLFKGSPISFQGDGLSALEQGDLINLQKVCLDYGMYFTLPPAQPAPVQAAQPAPVQPVPATPRAAVAEPAALDLIVHRTLRSGQKIHSEGSIIIWGDVHESAELTAGGDVIVLGKLEGLAHAGCYGDNKCYIFALNLQPRQLRIGSYISRSSGEMVVPDYPEVAFVSEDNICIKEYSSRDTMFR